MLVLGGAGGHGWENNGVVGRKLSFYLGSHRVK